MKPFDQIRNSQTEGEPQLKFERLEGCPQCHESDLSTIVGRQSISGCTAHRCCWFAGLNPFSTPFADVEADQRKNWAALGLETFHQVQPWYLGQTATA